MTAAAGIAEPRTTSAFSAAWRETTVEIDLDAKREHRELPPMVLPETDAVHAFLEAQGFGAFDLTGLRSPVGRNAVWMGPTTSGRPVFVKRLQGSDRDTSRRMARLLAFERFSSALPDRLPAPRLIAHDAEHGVVAFELVPDARSGAELVVDESFTPEHADEVGVILGALHASDAPDPAMDRSRCLLPSSEAMRSMPIEAYEELSFGEIQAFSLLQNDHELCAAIDALLQSSTGAPAVPIHGDFRMDQLLHGPEGLLLTDWEEFRLEDGARDVGSFAGEWVYRAVLDIVTDRSGLAPLTGDLAEHEVLERGASNLALHAEKIRRFTSSYLARRGTVDPTFLARATAFAGWHTLERLIAGGSRSSRLSAIERAAAGVGRSMVIQPQRFASVVGLVAADV